ncbi:hypothetical protein [Acetobacter senegalensis]|uniref:hypothetical protein n=1 Tax=Acetobacter senegalensis TaxID=446692 RepID=UPI001B80E52B|nr:hypothetical protein [Acetobacter senegalensis]
MMFDENILDTTISNIIFNYKISFSNKIHTAGNEDFDVIMNLFNITPELKRENRQYWGRELGMCWQRIVTALCQTRCSNFQPAIRIGADEPFDLAVGQYAIDTKYRIGSGDAGTLKKFRENGARIKALGYTPVLLIVRSDNLNAAITACKSGGWDIYHSQAAFAFIHRETGFNLYNYLFLKKGAFSII